MHHRDTQQARIERVIDGDTVIATMGAGLLHAPKKVRIRLYGIDAPERSQLGGPEATKYLTKLIGSRKNVWLDIMDTDLHDRPVGMLYHRRNHPQNSYNLRMVEGGHARCYMTKPIHRTQYLQAEEKARSKKRGMWKKKNRIDPWEYRRGEKEKQGAGHGKFLLIAMLLALAAAASIYFQLLH